MTDTPVTDEFTCNRAVAILEKAKRAEALLNEAEALYSDMDMDTHAEIPDLQDIICTASGLTNDIDEALNDYAQGVAA